MPLCLFCASYLLLGMWPPIYVLNETSLEKTDFSFASGYHLKTASGPGMGIFVDTSLFSTGILEAYILSPCYHSLCEVTCAVLLCCVQEALIPQCLLSPWLLLSSFFFFPGIPKILDLMENFHLGLSVPSSLTLHIF